MVIRDGAWTLVDSDIKLGRYRWVRDNGDGTQTERVDYNVARLLAVNAEQRNIAKKGWGGDWHHVASIPLGVLYGGALKEAHAEGDTKYIDKWLNDSDNRAWRTKGGNL